MPVWLCPADNISNKITLDILSDENLSFQLTFPNLFETFGPRLLCSGIASLGVLGFLEPTEDLLGEVVLLPDPQPLGVFGHQGAADGSVQRCQTVGRRQKTLPGLLQGPVQRS